MNKNNSEISYLCGNIFPVIVGTILIWKGVLDIAEAYIPKKIHYDIFMHKYHNIIFFLYFYILFKAYDILN